ncbi:MAG TPA: chloride channel protein, partial [Victivallales bacterium]|nr:chloride channel protein [Victivallales bacterium]
MICSIISVIFIFVISKLSVYLDSIASTKSYLYLILPALGGLLVGPIIKYVAMEAKGHGVPNVINAVLLERGKIRPIVAIAKIISSILTIGTGGSCGREGPIVQIGATVGSCFSQVLGLTERRTITLLASGAAAGISATFNAPISGVLFATEIIMKKAGIKEYASIVVASVISSVISRSILGDHPAFFLGSSYSFDYVELPLYVLLGCFSALIAIIFNNIFHKTENLFENLPLNTLFKPALGGLICGIFLFFAPGIYGSGFPAIQKALTGDYPLKILFLFLIAKIFATSFTLGSGGSGGVFAPLLFIGAIFGSLYDKITDIIFPSTSGNGAYSIVAMAAVFAAAAKAPVTPVILVFEMSRDYNIILPLMLGSITALLISHAFSSDSIYTIRLKEKGIDPDLLESKNLLENITVKDAMIPDSHIVKVPAYMPIRDLEAYFHMKGVKRAVVVDSASNLFGMVNIKDLYRKPELVDSGIVADICSKNPIIVRADDSLEDAALLFGSEPYHTIPVVDTFNSKKILGLLRREDIISAYSNALKNKNVMEKYLRSRRIQKAVSAELIELKVNSN